jgi:cytochrome P450
MVAQIGAGATREQAFQRARDVMQLQRFVREAIELRRKSPGTDLISLLVHARTEDDSAPQLTERELMSITTTAVAGGVDTTRNGIAFGLHALATVPGLLQRLRESAEQEKDLGRFIEETLRFYTPVPQLPRVATREIQFGGKIIAAGSLVFLCWASGNRDAKRFADADTFNLDRANSSQQLAFGTGVHFCIGAMLARQEMRCAFREIVNQVRSMELAMPSEQLDLSSSFIVLRGLTSLPVRFQQSRPLTHRANSVQV